MRRRWWVFIVAAGVAFRVFLLAQPEPLWYDEAFSVVVARLEPARLVAATAGDVHPPLYYLLLHDWLAVFGGVELPARALSFVFSMVALFLYYHVLDLFTLSDTERHTALCLAAWLPALSFFSVEARMYALLEALVMLAVLATFYIPSTPIAELVLSLVGGVAVGLLCLTHNAGLLYAPAIAAGALVYHVRRGVPLRLAVSRLLIVTGAALIVYAPWGGVLLSQVRTTSAGYWVIPPSPAGIPYNLAQSFIYLVSHTTGGVDAAMLVVVAAITTWGAWLMLRNEPEALAVPCIVILAAFVGSHVAGVGMLLHRMLVPLSFFWLIGWARVLSRPDVGRAVAVPVVAVLVVSNALYANTRVGADYSVWQGLEMHQGDIIYANNSSAMPLLLYGPDGVPVVVSSWQDNPMATGLSLDTITALGMDYGTLEDIEWGRVWYLWFKTPYTTDMERSYRDEILSRYDAELVSDLGGDDFTQGELWLLRHGPAAKQ